MKIIQDNKEYEINYHGIKIFDCLNPSLFIKENFLSKNCFVEINNKAIKEDEIIIFDDLSKIESFFKFSKSSILVEKLIEKIETLPLINQDNQEKIKNLFNQEFNFNILETNEGDHLKIINLLFEIVSLNYLDSKSLEILLLEILAKKRHLIIFNDLSWIKINYLTKFLNLHDFIIVTSDFRKYISNINQLELVCLVSANNYFEIEDANKLVAYLEQKMNMNIDQNFINNLKKDYYSDNAYSFLKYVKKLANI